MNLFTQHPWSWSFIALFISGLLYMMVVIKEEKRSYQDSSINLSFAGLIFPIPSWWRIKEQTKSKVIFERQDTRYDWQASLNWSDHYDPQISIQEQCVSTIKEMKLEFDEDASIILNPSDFSNHPNVQDGKLEIARIEGTATKEGIKRKYVDIFLVRDLKQQGHLLALSTSSVLNGVVEGPYFEEMMTHFKIGK